MVSQTRVDAFSAYDSDISDDELYSYYKSEFSSPDPDLEQLYETKLEEMLAVFQLTILLLLLSPLKKQLIN